MSKYNVGDVIKLRDDLEDEQEFEIIAGIFVVDEDVLELKNIPLKIVEYKKKHGYYIVEFSDGKKGRICDEMIEGLWEECKEKQDKLKLIDVLNMIAKGELKVGTIVKYDEEIYTFSVENKLERELGFTLLDDIYMNNLNDEVELIEPECKHEWNSAGKLCGGIQTTHKVCKKCGFEEITEKRIFDEEKTSEPTKIEEIEISDRYYTVQEIIGKLNEVIRKINKE